MVDCFNCVHWRVCKFINGEVYSNLQELKNACPSCMSADDVVEVVRCKDCIQSSEPKSVSRLELYCSNYDVVFCKKDGRNVCGTAFCSYGERKK